MTARAAELTVGDKAPAAAVGAFTVAAGVARSLFDYATAKGADPHRLAEHAGLLAAKLDDADQRIGSETYIRLMRTAQSLTGDPALALHWASDVNLSRFSIVGLLSQAAPTMADAFAQVKRYGRLVTDTTAGADRFSLAMVDGWLWSIDGRPDPNSFPELTETTFAFMVCGSRVAAPSDWLKEVHVTHPAPAYAAEYERVFQAPVVFGSRWNALRIDPAFLTVPVNVQPRYVFGVLSRHADALIAELERSRTLTSQLEMLIAAELHTGDVSVERLADRMRMSRRTLHRRLKAENTTFEQVLDGLRRRLAVAYLENPRVAVHEVALLVGYSETAAFSRAFRRWTGRSPRGGVTGTDED